MTTDIFLMSKNEILARINFDTMFFEVYKQNLMPFALRGANVNLFTVRDWLIDRTLNLSRSNAKTIINVMGFNQNDRLSMCITCKALSLTDCYWIKSEGSTDTWEKVNLYRNSLSSAIAKIALTGEYISITGRPRTPELTNGGSYAKCWKRRKDGVYLYKSGSLQGNGKEHLIEVLCSDLLDSLDVEHIRYILTETDGREVSCCKNMTTEDKSICNMQYIYGYYSRNGKLAELESFLKADSGYFKMFIVDYLLNNTDRHTGNWGVYFDANSGKIIKLHPLFDHNLALNPSKNIPSLIIQGKTLQETAFYAKRHYNLDVMNLLKLLKSKVIQKRFFDIFGGYTEYNAMLDRIDDYLSWK